MGESKPLDVQALGRQLTEAVEKRVDRVFVEVLDEEQWKQLVAGAIKRFTQPRSMPQSFGKDKVKPSELEELVSAHVRKKLSEWLKSKLDEPGWNPLWDDTKSENMPGEIVTEIIKHLLPDIIKAQYGSLIERAVESTKEELSRSAGISP